MRLYCLADEPSNDLLKNINTLQQVPVDVFKQLVQASIKVMLSSSSDSVDSVDTLKTALEQAAVSASCPVEHLVTVVTHLQFLWREIVRRNVKLEQLVADLQQLGFSNEIIADGDERCRYMLALWRKHFISVSTEVLAQTLQVSPLVDMDWRFVVTASSSEQERVGKTALQLKLQLEKNDSSLEHVYLELSLSQFYSFLHQMEKAKAALDFFS